MTSFGYTLSSEEHSPVELVTNARRAEAAGFEFVSISDHYHPWVTAQGHSPFVWGVLGAISQSTETVAVGVGVTCPIVRVHPAVVAQAAATASLLLDGRFFLGVGTGEALNEHIVGRRWPPPSVRLEMLEEAVDVIRALFTGETIEHRGAYYEVDNARLFDPPAAELPIVVSGFGPESAALAGRIGDGYWGNAPDPDLINAFAAEGGAGPHYAQLNVCWNSDKDEAERTVHRVWPNAGISGQLSQDLPTWTHFEQAAETVRPEDAVSSVPCGPDITKDVIASVAEYVEAGYDHLYFHQIGADQEPFLHYWETDLAPALA